MDSLGEQLDAGAQEDSDLLEQSDISLESGEDGEAAQFSSSDMRLLRSKDSVNWVQMCTAPIAATSDVQPLIEQINGVWSTKRDYTRFLAMIMKLHNQTNKIFHWSKICSLLCRLLWKYCCGFRIDKCIGSIVFERGCSAKHIARFDGCF